MKKKSQYYKKLFILIIFLIISINSYPFYISVSVIILMWILNELFYSDHIKYDQKQDYKYFFTENIKKTNIKLKTTLKIPPGDNTLILQIKLKSSLLGKIFDPYISITSDRMKENRQYFERGLNGIRYINLSGYNGLKIKIKESFCKIKKSYTHVLFQFKNPDFDKKKIMILAPHADDAEIAAFGLYSRYKSIMIITITQGEIESYYYKKKFGLNKQEASTLKGRIRSWDSLSIPLWGGISQDNCFQLGYYCLQLSSMRKYPNKIFGSKESCERCINPVRRHNPLTLPGDIDGLPTWNNLIADLYYCLNHFNPDIIVCPHPELDSHEDHIATTQALLEALTKCNCSTKTLLLYVNHIYNYDSWPLGPAYNGTALPPNFKNLPLDELFSIFLSSKQQLYKIIALSMQHDLQPSLSIKKIVRRYLQTIFLGRRWPYLNNSEFFRKSVRSQELFWVRIYKKE